MSPARLIASGVVALMFVLCPQHRAYGAVHWQPETAVYFEVWYKGKAECQEKFLRALHDAQARPTVAEQRAAITAVKYERCACRHEAKARAHAASARARKDRWDRIRATRGSKNGNE